MAEIDEILSDNIKRLREQKSWSQAKLAEVAGVSLGTIQAYEARRRWPELVYVRALAAAFGCSTADLYQGPSERGPASAHTIYEYIKRLEEENTDLRDAGTTFVAAPKRDYERSPRTKK